MNQILTEKDYKMIEKLVNLINLLKNKTERDKCEQLAKLKIPNRIWKQIADVIDCAGLL